MFNNNNLTKQYVFESGYLKIYVSYQHYLYFMYKNLNNEIDEIPLDYLPFADFIYYIENFPLLAEIAYKMYNSRRCKVRRLRKRLALMFQYSEKENFLFLTFTFNEFSLNRLSKNTRRTYVRRFCTDLNCSYVANIDFGEKYEREHYHAVVATDFVNALDWSKYGWLHFENIANIQNDYRAIGAYIDKLANHATKDTADRAIFSRDLSKYDKMQPFSNNIVF